MADLEFGSLALQYGYCKMISRCRNCNAYGISSDYPS